MFENTPLAAYYLSHNPYQKISLPPQKTTCHTTLAKKYYLSTPCVRQKTHPTSNSGFEKGVNFGF